MPYVGYAVELYFDPVMTAKIKILWDAIRIKCGDSGEIGVQPHISLAVIEDEQKIRRHGFCRITSTLREMWRLRTRGWKTLPCPGARWRGSN